MNGELRGLFVKLFEDFSIFGSPFDKSIRAAAFNDRCCGTWTRKRYILDELIKTIFLGECAIGNHLFSEGSNGWPILC